MIFCPLYSWRYLKIMAIFFRTYTVFKKSCMAIFKVSTYIQAAFLRSKRRQSINHGSQVQLSLCLIQWHGKRSPKSLKPQFNYSESFPNSTERRRGCVADGTRPLRTGPVRIMNSSLNNSYWGKLICFSEYDRWGGSAQQSLFSLNDWCMRWRGQGLQSHSL